MKRLITAMFALAAGLSVATAADLPSKKAAPAPVVSAFDVGGWYAGVYGGGNFRNDRNINLNATPGVLGAQVGYEWNRYVRTEATVDYTTATAPVTGQSGQTAFANVILQYPVGYGFTPYVLAGAGAGWNGWGKVGTGNANALYNVGGGVRYALTNNFELDGRYRYIDSFNGTRFNNNHVVTLGVGYKF